MSARAVIQWAAVLVVAAAGWGVGQANIHILNYPLFIGVLFLLGLGLVLVVAATATPEDLEEPETHQNAADRT